MKNVKNHAKQRYCERILGITDSNEWKRYLAQNDEMVCNHINKMVDNSLFIYRGQIGDNTTKVFRMADNIVLVMDSQETCVITLFKCYFDFGDDMDRQIIKHELLRLDELHNGLKNIDAEIQDFVEQVTVTSTTLDMQIKAMEEQLRLLKAQKTSADEAIKGKRAGREFTVKEIEKIAVRLCNSLEYRRDLQAS
ncbi:hypothetical protein [Paenibacillus xylanexedens]|uniref:hypothetical protein n=1 Tax=Paenibacillus xylanexedens TaxID=528191 RepID=UPI000F541509|nr:hypothetical protein [Paenibacillus xylanexedens]